MFRKLKTLVSFFFLWLLYFSLFFRLPGTVSPRMFSYRAMKTAAWQSPRVLSRKVRLHLLSRSLATSTQSAMGEGGLVVIIIIIINNLECILEMNKLSIYLSFYSSFHLSINPSMCLYLYIQVIKQEQEPSMLHV